MLPRGRWGSWTASCLSCRHGRVCGCRLVCCRGASWYKCLHGHPRAAVHRTAVGGGSADQAQVNRTAVDPFANLQTDLVSGLQASRIDPQPAGLGLLPAHAPAPSYELAPEAPQSNHHHTTTPRHTAAKSADEILKLFDAPRPNRRAARGQ